MGHTIDEVHHDAGQTGRFGEAFVVLGLLIFVFGLVLFLMGQLGSFSEQAISGTSVHVDALSVGFLFLVEGAGFAAFGVLAVLSGWGRSHPEYDAP